MSSDYKNDIQSFFNDLQFRKEVYETFKEKYEPFVAFDFNVFDFIRPDENGLSSIIRELLDPRGSHGQGEAFLRQFLEIKAFNDHLKEREDLKNTEIVCENPTKMIDANKRRIDLTIKFKDNFGIAIENKPWAGEQEDQIRDYDKHMGELHGSNYKIIFLTRDGRKPSSFSGENKLLRFTYQREIKNWLKTCQEKCRSEKVRFFLQDFINYIETHLTAEEDQENEQ